MSRGIGLVLALTTLIGAGVADAQALYTLPDRMETRWASPENPTGARGAGGEANAGRKGSPFIAVPAGGRVVLAEASGTSGLVRRIWVTLSDRTPAMLRGIRIEMFWDGAGTPAVSAPLGDFFGHALGEMRPFQSALFSSPEGRSLVTIVPMPFRTGMRIVLTNETSTALEQLFYDVDYTVGDAVGADALYFHAVFRRERPTTIQRDYEILPHVTGRGRYVGATLGVIADTTRYGKSWWGEGEVKVYLDGDSARPTLNGTGTEDYIGTAYGQGPYAQAYQGCPLADEERFRYGFYRLHVPDAIYFRSQARVTIQQIGYYGTGEMGPLMTRGQPVMLAGAGPVPMDLTKPDQLFERQDDWSSVAYFYLDRPENGLPAIPPLADRVAGL